MYEWIQEAIVKGMTDVHEIQRYARQKQISLVRSLSPLKKYLWDEGRSTNIYVVKRQRGVSLISIRILRLLVDVQCFKPLIPAMHH